MLERRSQGLLLKMDSLSTVALNETNKIAIQATAQMAADKEAVGLSRVYMYQYKCILHITR